MVVLLGLGLTGVLVAGSYLVFFIYRIFTKIMGLSMNIWLWLFVIGLAVLLSLPAVNLFSVYTVGYFYFLGLSAVFEILYFFVKNDKLRQFFQSGLISVIVVGLFIGWGYYNMNHVVKTDFTVSSHKVNNLKLLAISDLHMGLSITSEKLSKYVDEMNRLETPDFVFLVGDIVDERTDVSDMRSAFKSLSQLKSRNGIYYVYGNHDDNKYIGENAHFNHDDIKKECEVHNIQVLEDEIKTIGNITLIGRKDASFSRKSSSELLKNVDKKNYIIVLDHQPLDMKENASNKADLQVSGHTHGGQIWPLGILQAITTGTMRYGVKKIDQFYTVTTSGIAGWGYPIKTGAPSEYAYITVK
ncbi:hypothetical protein B7939_10110 [Eggerthia catenaformis]|nr:hypothetical protein B7939_10110 [Eggerthia catenaformis]